MHDDPGILAYFPGGVSIAHLHSFFFFEIYNPFEDLCFSCFLYFLLSLHALTSLYTSSSTFFSVLLSLYPLLPPPFSSPSATVMSFFLLSNIISHFLLIFFLSFPFFLPFPSFLISISFSHCYSFYLFFPHFFYPHFSSLLYSSSFIHPPSYPLFISSYFLHFTRPPPLSFFSPYSFFLLLHSYPLSNLLLFFLLPPSSLLSPFRLSSHTLYLFFYDLLLFFKQSFLFPSDFLLEHLKT